MDRLPPYFRESQVDDVGVCLPASLLKDEREQIWSRDVHILYGGYHYFLIYFGEIQ